MGRRGLLMTAAGAALVLTARAPHAELATVRVGYLRWTERRPTISLLDKPPPDDGLAGARLAISDNNTTGRFMNQQFDLSDVSVREDDDPVAALAGLAGQGIALVLTDVPADRLLTLAAAAADKGVTLFNIAAPDDALRLLKDGLTKYYLAPEARLPGVAEEAPEIAKSRTS